MSIKASMKEKYSMIREMEKESIDTLMAIPI